MDDLRAFLGKRQQEVMTALEPVEAKIEEARKQLEALKAQRERLNAELVELNRAAGAIGMPMVALPEREPPPRSRQQTTIKDAIRLVLSNELHGLPAIDILDQINQRFGWDVPRTSLSPQLTRLKKEGKVQLHGRLWRLATK